MSRLQLHCMKRSYIAIVIEAVIVAYKNLTLKSGSGVIA